MTDARDYCGSLKLNAQNEADAAVLAGIYRMLAFEENGRRKLFECVVGQSPEEWANDTER